MGLFSKNNGDATIWDGNLIPEPAYQYKKDDKSYYVFLMDDHPNKDKIMKTKLSAVDYSKKVYKIILEKEAYDLTPEYYSEPVLVAHFNFYNGVGKEVRNKMLFGSILLAGIAFVITAYVLKLDSLTSSFITLFVALAYMFIFMNKIFNSILKKHRKMLRDTMITLFGEARLDEMLDVQDAYNTRRRKELDSTVAEVTENKEIATTVSETELPDPESKVDSEEK